jgi:hypothetical protein
MSTHCLVFIRSWIPRHRVNSCHFWTPIQAIIKSVSPLTTKKNSIYHTVWDILLHQDDIRAKEWGGTYQKCVHIILEAQIGRIIEAYIDDIVVKLKKQGDLLDDLKETFDNLCKYKMMLNSKKCVFGVSSGKLLGYMVSSRGIDVNSKKVEVIGQLQPPQTRKEIQKLAGMMIALSQFICKLGEHDMPFYKLLRKADGFQWDE